MPDSGRAETTSPGDGEAGDGAAGRELGALGDAVDRLLEAYADLRRRVEEAEASRRRLVEALGGTDPDEMTPEEAEERFRELAEENERLREVVREGRERAERIRSRLIMMEDEL